MIIAAPAPPENASVVDVGQGSIKIRWLPPASRIFDSFVVVVQYVRGQQISM